jgi:exodeoxyribonuclease VII large subunit
VMPTTSELLTTPKIYTVTEVTREIRKLLEAKYRTIWIEGEVSNCKHHSSGHIYFTLKDGGAQMNAVFFARENQSLKFDLKDGLKIIVVGRISVYDVRGQYQLYVQRAEPKGLGALQLAFLQLKERLEKEGLFSSDRKKEIPTYPRRIGIVTSPTGAAIQDMLKIFKKRTFGLEVFLYPVRVQGDEAKGEIADAIRALDDREEPLDLIIVGRGGGSLEDLWAFNEEVVARAIFNSKTPIISAVGHEVDWTIADFVSDQRAHTPTAAAELVVTNWDELDWRLRQLGERMKGQMQMLFTAQKEALENLKNSYAFRQPKVYLERLQQQVDELIRQFQTHIKTFVQIKRHTFQSLIGKLEALSPLASLGRGYSITFNREGAALKDAEGVRVGEEIKTRLCKGFVKSKVTEKGA